MNNPLNIRENSPDEAAGSSENATNKKLVVTRRQAIIAGILSLFTGAVAFENANKEKISGAINKFFTRYDVYEGENLESIEKKNIPLSKDLVCTSLSISGVQAKMMVKIITNLV